MHRANLCFSDTTNRYLVYNIYTSVPHTLFLSSLFLYSYIYSRINICLADTKISGGADNGE